jgi:hypothetical protein
MTTPTAPSARMGVFIPWANTVRDFLECYGTHLSTSATMGMSPSTTIVPFRPMAWTSTRLGCGYPSTQWCHGWGPSVVASLTTPLRRWCMQLSRRCVSAASPPPLTCGSCSSLSTTRRTPCGSSASRSCPTSRAHTSMLDGQRWPST